MDQFATGVDEKRRSRFPSSPVNGDTSVKFDECPSKIRSSAAGSSLVEPGSRKYFRHEEMVLDMLAKGRVYDGDLLNDVFHLIYVYYIHGSNNLDKVSFGVKKTLELRHLYGIKCAAKSTECWPTLSRISEAFPHISLALSTQLLSHPRLGYSLRSRFEEFGSGVSYHFQMNYFPGLINVDGSASAKPQFGLFLFNLCQCKTIVKTMASPNVPWAFTASCLSTSIIMEQHLAPPESKKRFTNFVESLPISAELMHKVWTQVIGDVEIISSSKVFITRFHEKVLRAQPLNLAKWTELVEED